MPIPNLTRVITGLIRFVQRDAPIIVKVEAVNHFRRSFQPSRQGFTDETLEKWPDITAKRKAEKIRANGSLPPILTGVSERASTTGHLHDSIRGEVHGNTVIVSTDKAYAQRHNEGLAGMPKRQFMGRSRTLERNIKAEFDRSFRQILGR